MAYIDITYYKTTYLGTDPDDDTELSRAIARASDDIDMNTMYGIVLADLTDAQLAMVKKATAAQTEYYIVNGDQYNESSMPTSERIGSYSRGGGSNSSRSSMALCDRARAYLEQSGLMYRMVATLGPTALMSDDDE